MMKFIKINKDFSLKNHEKLVSFESYFNYPLGDDSFSISHGENYLSFFERIGKPTLYGTMEDEITSIGAGVISRRWKSWYLCDMKVHPGHRNKRLSTKLFTRYFLVNYLKCQRAFALNMQSSDGKKNSIVKIMESLPWTPLKVGARLLFFYEDAENTKTALEIISRNRKGIYFSNIQNQKSLILKSTNKAIPLLHMEWGENERGETEHSVTEGMLHMWSLQDDDPMVRELESKGIRPKGSGLIFHYRMKGMDWGELRTSEL